MIESTKIKTKTQKGIDETKTEDKQELGFIPKKVFVAIFRFQFVSDVTIVNVIVSVPHLEKKTSFAQVTFSKLVLIGISISNTQFHFYWKTSKRR